MTTGSQSACVNGEVSNDDRVVDSVGLCCVNKRRRVAWSSESEFESDIVLLCQYHGLSFRRNTVFSKATFDK